MADEKGIAYAILGIVAVIAVVGLVLLFKGSTGDVSYSNEMRQGKSELKPSKESPTLHTNQLRENNSTSYALVSGYDDVYFNPATNNPILQGRVLLWDKQGNVVNTPLGFEIPFGSNVHQVKQVIIDNTIYVGTQYGFTILPKDVMTSWP